MNLSDLALANLLGLVVGMISSFASWWVLFHWFVPEVEFSPFISKITRKGGSGFSYRIKLKNTGLRSIIGVEIYARLWIDWHGNGNWIGLYLPFSGEGDKKYDIPVFKRRANRILSFFINAVPAFQTNIKYPEPFRQKAKDRVICMEDVLCLGKDAYIQVFVSGFDSFSGARRVYESRKFRKSDIYPNLFSKSGLGLGLLSKAAEVPSQPPAGEA